MIDTLYYYGVQTQTRYYNEMSFLRNLEVMLLWRCGDSNSWSIAARHLRILTDRISFYLMPTPSAEDAPADRR